MIKNVYTDTIVKYKLRKSHENKKIMALNIFHRDQTDILVFQIKFKFNIFLQRESFKIIYSLFMSNIYIKKMAPLTRKTPLGNIKEENTS